MKDFGKKKQAELAMVASTIEKLFPSNDERISALAVMIWIATVATWKENKRNALPLLKERVREMLAQKMPDDTTSAGVPGTFLLEQVGWSIPISEEIKMLQQMFRMEAANAESVPPQGPGPTR